MTSQPIAPSMGLHYAEPPQQHEPAGATSWITRSANVVVVVTQAAAGTELVREDNPDEYMLLLPPGVRAELQAGAQQMAVEGDTLSILPPGASRVRLRDAGVVTRVFTVRANDLATLAANADTYAQGAPGVAPLVDWPMPVDGYRIRNYRLVDYCDPAIFGRLFRSRNLMVNVFEHRNEPRDPRKLSPHSHVEFEQISLALAGRFIHHLRTPWGADSSGWREDVHVEMHSPSTLVIPTHVIHTTQAVGDGVNWLVDVFGPPRTDFSLQPGVVRNAHEYPMP